MLNCIRTIKIIQYAIYYFKYIKILSKILIGLLVNVDISHFPVMITRCIATHSENYNAQYRSINTNLTTSFTLLVISFRFLDLYLNHNIYNIVVLFSWEAIIKCMFKFNLFNIDSTYITNCYVFDQRKTIDKNCVVWIFKNQN